MFYAVSQRQTKFVASCVFVCFFFVFLFFFSLLFLGRFNPSKVESTIKMKEFASIPIHLKKSYKITYQTELSLFI